MANTSAAHKAEQQKSLRANEEKWTPALMTAAGWTALPSIILDKQPALGIDSVDLNILLQLAKYWWKKDDLPYPSKETLSELIGVTTSTIRRHIKRMEEEGLITRIERHDTKGGQQSNFYSFDGLIEKMLPHAQAAIELRKTQEADKVKLRRRKNIKATPAKFSVVAGGKQK
jgi:predicted transcriptional regulator